MPVLPLAWPVAAGLAAQDHAKLSSAMCGALGHFTVRSCWAVLGGVVAVALPAMPTRSVRRGTRHPARHGTRRGTGRTGLLLGRGTGRWSRIAAGRVAVGWRVLGPQPV